eukprot:Sdes_comp17024_c0_seq3m6226
MEVQMVPGKGPHFPQPLQVPEDIDAKLNMNADVDIELNYVYQAITLTRQKLEGKVPLFGFCGAPWTVMAYMIEGGGSKLFSKSKAWLFRYPEASHKLLNLISAMSIKYLVGQVRAGAQLLQVFESWAGELGPDTFRTFSEKYLKQIAEGVRKQLKTEGLAPVPMIIFAKGAHYALANLSKLGYDGMSLDCTIAPELARSCVRPDFVLQGNLDPNVLYAPVHVIKEHVEKMVKKFGKQKYIANLGHGMQPDHPVEGLQAFVEAIHSL